MVSGGNVPAELACSVFELLSYTDLVSATHVCRRWRTAGLGHGSLWTRIRCRHVEALAELLKRARLFPADVHVFDIKIDSLEPILQVVADHLCHIRLLALHAGRVKLGLENTTLVYRALATAAPLLEAFDVQLFDGQLPKPDAGDAILQADASRKLRPVPADLFRRQAPRLQKVSFSTMTLPESHVHALSNVTRLELDAISLTAAQLSVIVSLPSLRSLHLELVHCEVPQTPPPAGFHLDELWLFGPCEGGYVTPFLVPAFPLLLFLGFPRIRHFVYDACFDWLEAMSQLPRLAPHTLFIERWDYIKISRGFSIPCDAWRMIDSAGFISDQYGAHTGDNLSWPAAQQLFAGLQELVIPYYVLRMAADDNLEFRELTRLCVRIDEERVSNSDWPEFNIPCPRLRTLELWDGGVSIDAEEIVDFVRNLFVFDGQRPPALIIRNLRLTPIGAQLARLQGVVSSIQFPHGPAPESFVVELKSEWHVAVPL